MSFLMHAVALLCPCFIILNSDIIRGCHEFFDACGRSCLWYNIFIALLRFHAKILVIITERQYEQHVKTKCLLYALIQHIYLTQNIIIECFPMPLHHFTLLILCLKKYKQNERGKWTEIKGGGNQYWQCYSCHQITTDLLPHVPRGICWQWGEWDAPVHSLDWLYPHCPI